MKVGQIALKWCKVSLPLMVCKSAAGFYIGTMQNGEPMSRESVEYYATREKAEYALANDTWTQRPNP